MNNELLNIAIKHKVIHSQQSRTLPLRCTTDLAAALIDNVEEALVMNNNTLVYSILQMIHVHS